MTRLILLTTLLVLSGCSPEAARAIQAMNAQYQYNQAMEAASTPAFAPVAPMQVPMQTRCYQIGNQVNCSQF